MAYTTIDDPSAYFHIQLYTGTGSELSVTNDANAGDFKPDWIWIKQRNATTNHGMFDSNRGVTKNLKTDTTDAESTEAQSVKTFNTDGFTLGTSGDYNGSSDTHVAWQWKANGGTTTTNTAGTNIDTTVQANTTAGFSLMTYTGTGTNNDSIGHGLGAVPHWIMVKNRDETNGWQVYHHKNTSAPETDYLNLNDNGATADDHDRWSDQAPSSTVITLGGNDGVSKSSVKYVCYAFTEIQGYSKFGSYTGNGNADGPFVYTGFKPAWLMTKRTDSTSDWNMYDNKRNTFNKVDKVLQAEGNDAEYTSGSGVILDFLSNGFKVRGTGSGINADGGSYIYMAFAEHPFVSSKGVPVTAR
jgi:hypothetical protein